MANPKSATERLRQEGFFEFSILTTLSILNSGYSSPTTLAILANVFGLLLALGRTHSIQHVRIAAAGLAAVQLLYPGPIPRAGLLTICLMIGLPHQNTFECGLFAVVLAQARSLQEPCVAAYLFICIEMQIYAIAALAVLEQGSKSGSTYRAILLCNTVFAFLAIHPLKLHTQLIESPEFKQVLLLGACGLVGLSLLAVIVANMPSIPNIVRRKIFHLPPFLIFPLLNSQARPVFLVALAGIFYVLIFLELVRYHCNPTVNEAPRFLKAVWQWMGGFIDSRDTHFWVTHLSLFAGMMTSYFTSTGTLIQNAAIAIPIGDACAAIIGSSFGRIRIGRKTLEGTVAFVVGTFASFCILSYWLGEPMVVSELAVPIAACAFLELLSIQIDNLSLPVLFLQSWLLLRP